MKLENSSALMGVAVVPGEYQDFERRRKVHSFLVLNLLLHEQWAASQGAHHPHLELEMKRRTLDHPFSPSYFLATFLLIS